MCVCSHRCRGAAVVAARWPPAVAAAAARTAAPGRARGTRSPRDSRPLDAGHKDEDVQKPVERLSLYLYNTCKDIKGRACLVDDATCVHRDAQHSGTRESCVSSYSDMSYRGSILQSAPREFRPRSQPEALGRASD